MALLTRNSVKREVVEPETAARLQAVEGCEYDDEVYCSVSHNTVYIQARYPQDQSEAVGTDGPLHIAVFDWAGPSGTENPICLMRLSASFNRTYALCAGDRWFHGTANGPISWSRLRSRTMSIPSWSTAAFSSAAASSPRAQPADVAGREARVAAGRVARTPRANWR